MYDANGNWIPEPEEQTPPTPLGLEGPPVPPGMRLGDSPAQQEIAKPVAQGGLGINTTGDVNEIGRKQRDSYLAGERQFEDHTGQGRPQQYGTEEPIRQDQPEGPLTPGDAADAFKARADAAGGYKQLARQHTLGSGESVAAMQKRNAGYDAYAQRSDAAREKQRQALDQRGSTNRAADREKDADMWAQFRQTNALQGGGGMGGEQGPSLTNVGGALLLGPGFGSMGYGRHGGLGGASPEQLAIRQAELDERIKQHGTTNDINNKKVQIAGDKVDATKAATDAVMKRFYETQGMKAGATAQEQRNELDKLLADVNRRDLESAAAEKAGGNVNAAMDSGPSKIDRVTGRPLPGQHLPGSYVALNSRIAMLVDTLNKAHRAGHYEFNVDPTTKESLRRIYQTYGGQESMGDLSQQPQQ